MNNPPAFPRPSTVWDGMVEAPAQAGMSLREWYAGLALQGILANAQNTEGVLPLCDSDLPAVAAAAFRFADAMLAQREAPAQRQQQNELLEILRDLVEEYKLLIAHHPGDCDCSACGIRSRIERALK